MSKLNRDDFPTFGKPTMPIFRLFFTRPNFAPEFSAPSLSAVAAFGGMFTLCDVSFFLCPRAGVRRPSSKTARARHRLAAKKCNAVLTHMRAIVGASRHLSRVRARWARESDARVRSVANSAPMLVDADVNAHGENARLSLETVESAPSPSTVPRLPAALRTTAQGLNALSPRDVERTVRASLRLARQHVGEMDTFDVDVERALRRATRDVFDASNGGVRVGRRVGTRAERLLKALRARSGGYVTANGEDGLEPPRRALERSSSSASADDNVVAAWDDDITWGARLSRRKLRRVETGLLASSSAAAAKENVNSNSGTSLVLEERDAAVYAVMRSPMKMAALKRIFYETRDRVGDGFKPKSVLDFGSGPVPTTMMALRDVFGFDANVGATADGQDLRRRPRAGDAELRVAFVDGNPEMMRFARRVVGYAEREREDREEKARITAEFAALESSSSGDSAFDAFADDTVAEDDDGITRLDFTDFEATDEKPSTRPASAFRLKVPHPWHEAEGVRTTATLRGANRRGGFDVVVCSYALGESFDGISSQRSRDVTVRQLWERVAPGGVLVISEPGTPKGSLIVRRARHLVLEVARREMEQNARRLQAEPDAADVQAYVVAPCQHDKACPVKDEHREDGFSTWCHFPQRALRSSYYREIKQSAKPYQDEKFSYVVLRKMTRAQARQEAELATKRAAGRRRTPNTTADDNADEHDDEDDEHEEAFHAHVARESSEDWSRVIRHPHKRKGHVVVELCTSRGELERATIAKSHGQGDWAIGADGYKFARKLRWGDLWPYANKTTIAPGDQKHFMLEAAAFEEKYLADLRAAADPSASLPGAAAAIAADDDVPDDSTFFAMLEELDAAVSNTSK